MTGAPLDPLFLELQDALAGAYSIERELGRGGMGVVYLAREVRLARAVALKVLPPDRGADPAIRERFLREAQMAARLSHPNIVPIHRVDEAGDFVYYAMTFVDGETLADHLRTHGPMPPHRAVKVLREVAWALTYAHAAGIVHRDVKAENVLLERGTGRALVTDFGIALAGRSDPDGHAGPGVIVGSAHYVSPEQAMGEPTDARSDIYSLGVLAYALLSGRLPFAGATVQQTLAMHIGAAPPPLAAVAPTVPSRLAAVVGRCLAKLPDERFQSAADVAEAVDATVGGQGEVPAPLRLWVTAEEREHRGRWFVGGGGAVMMIVAAVAGVPLPVVAFQGLIFATAATVPLLYRVRRLASAGYGLDDMRAALDWYWRLRREEMAHDAEGPLALTPTRLAVVGGLATVAAASSALFAGTQPGAALAIVLAAGGVATTAFVLAIGNWVRKHRGSREPSVLRFWRSGFAEKLVAFARRGVRPATPAQALPQLTEVALGRSTDAIYASLPPALREGLEELPGVVARLSADATRLRAEIDRLDAEIGALGHEARLMSDASRTAVDGAEVGARRDALREQLRGMRERANERLVETVAALERIRLDLLRLRGGSISVASVTASLEGAREVAEQVARLAAASEEVDAVLRDRSPAAPVPS